MNFLADESCAGPVIQALREAGHDVVAIAEVAKGTVDELVMRRALSERRILITEDPDFGELMYARGHSGANVGAEKPVGPVILSPDAAHRGEGPPVVVVGLQ